MEAQNFIDIFLPDFVSQAFDVVNIQSDAWRIDIFLDEKKIVPTNMPNKHLISHGFTPVTTIQDFPIRGKAVYLHIRRRKWLNNNTLEVSTNKYDLTHLGTQITTEFADFLKGIHRKLRP